MTTTSFSKAKAIIVRVERTAMVTISWKEFNGMDIVTRSRQMKAWEALNLLDNINKIAFVKLAA